MPANALAHIYDEFYQVGVSGSTARDGYGLGLSIVNRIVNLLGHRLEVRSELGKGSAFSLELPRGQTMQACTAAQCGQASAWVNAQCAAHGDIALLVTDYHLANQETGVQVIAAVRSQLAADLKAILITGDTSAAAHAIQHNDRVRMTSKPINADEFTSLLRELIEV
jgi:two-component system CheB/CheR fusion protein